MNGVLHDAADTHLHTRIQAVGSLVGVKRRVCLSSFTTLRYPSILSSVNYITANTHSTSRRDGPDLVRLVGIYIVRCCQTRSYSKRERICRGSGIRCRAFQAADREGTARARGRGKDRGGEEALRDFFSSSSAHCFGDVRAENRFLPKRSLDHSQSHTLAQRR
jgi:hypothetical protein